MSDTEILIIGAGASALIAARELSKAGKKVLVLEARERTGGRIMSFSENIFGYAAEAGAEFVHGDLHLTKSLVAEAGLTLVPTEGEMWRAKGGELTKNQEFISGWPLFIGELKELKEDITVIKFLEMNFPEEKYKNLHNSVKGFVEGFDAADPEHASAISLRDELISEFESQQFRIKEGYGALIGFLERECIKNGVEIKLNSEVKAIEYSEKKIVVICRDEKTYEAQKIILTVPLPVLSKITFCPLIVEKLKLSSEIKIGKVIKFLLHFSTRWWENINGKDLHKAGFIFSNEVIPTWWTQYPEKYPVLTGWLAGPEAEKIINSSQEKLLDFALTSLSDIFKRDKEGLRIELTCFKVIDWGADPFALGAYAYATPGMQYAKKEMLKPVEDKLWFSGEALYEGSEIGTVEGALKSGIRTAREILDV